MVVKRGLWLKIVSKIIWVIWNFYNVTKVNLKIKYSEQ